MSFNLKLENNAPSFFPNLEMQAKQSTWHSLVHLETAESGGCVDGKPGPMSSPSNRTAPVGAGQNPSPILCDGRRRIFGAVGLSLVGCVRPASGRGSHPPLCPAARRGLRRWQRTHRTPCGSDCGSRPEGGQRLEEGPGRVLCGGGGWEDGDAGCRAMRCGERGEKGLAPNEPG